MAKKKPRILQKVLFGIIFAAFALVFILPLLVRVPELQNTLPVYDLADEDSHFVNIEGWDIHYKMEGEGKPAIILLHGFGASLFSWRDVIKPMSRFGTVIAYDRPAFGLTERPVSDTKSAGNFYASQNQAELLLLLMDKLGIEQAILVGHSAGGTVSVDFAIQHPEKVAGLILIAPAIFESGGTSAWLRALFQLPQFDRIGPLIARGFISRTDNILDLSWYDPSRITPEIFEGYRKPLSTDNWDFAFWRFITSSRPIDLREEISSLQMPVLVVSGDNDRIVPLENSREVARMIPAAIFIEIPDCGHLPHEENPEAFIIEANIFLNSILGTSLWKISQ